MAGLTMYHDRQGRRMCGDGLGLLHKSALKVKVQTKIQAIKSFECMDADIQSRSGSIKLVIIYRHPKSSKAVFLTDFTQLLEGHAWAYGHVIIAGDFNFY